MFHIKICYRLTLTIYFLKPKLMNTIYEIRIVIRHFIRKTVDTQGTPQKQQLENHLAEIMSSYIN